MRISLTASFLVHAALLSYALFWVPAVAPFKVEPQDSIPIEIVTIADAPKTKAVVKEPAPKVIEKPKPKAAEVVKEVKPQEKIAPEEVKAAHEKNVVEDAPKPEKKPEPPKPKVEEAKPEEPKPLDSKELAELLAEPEPPKKEPEKKPEPKSEPKPVEKPKDEPPPDQAALDAILKTTADEQQAEAEKKAAEEEARKKSDAEAKKKADADAKKKSDADAKKKASADAKKKADAEAKKLAAAEAAKKKKTAFDTNAVADLLNKIPDDPAAPQKPSEETGTPDVADRNDTGADDALAATLSQALISHLYDCWKLPPGAKDAAISVKVKFALNPDGTLRGQPQIVNSNGDPLFDTTARSVLSAIKRCETYEFLPRDKYDLWEQNTVNFRADQQNPA